VTIEELVEKRPSIFGAVLSRGLDCTFVQLTGETAQAEVCKKLILKSGFRLRGFIGILRGGSVELIPHDDSPATWFALGRAVRGLSPDTDNGSWLSRLDGNVN